MSHSQVADSQLHDIALNYIASSYDSERNRTKMRLKKIIVLAAAAFASVMSFAASVWRGETAYVNIPERSAQALLPLNGTSQDGVEIHLAYYDDVAYETKPGKRSFGPMSVEVVDRVLPPARTIV